MAHGSPEEAIRIGPAVDDAVDDRGRRSGLDPTESPADPPADADERLFAALAASPSLSALPEPLVRRNLGRFRFRNLPDGATILREGEANHRIFLITDGQAEVLKRSGDGAAAHRIAMVETGEECGEVTVVDGATASATVRALGPLRLLEVDLGPDAEGRVPEALLERVLTAVGQRLAQRLRESSLTRARSIERELEAEQLTSMAGRFVLVVMSLFATYTIVLRAIADRGIFPWMQSFGSPLVIVAFMGGVVFLMRRSPFPGAFFGMTLKGWAPATRDAVLFSALFCAALVAAKAAYIALVPGAADMPLFALSSIAARYGPDGSLDVGRYALMIVLYLALCPVQELIGRCGVQAPLYEFLKGGETGRHVASIVVSNLLAVASHAHLSLVFALATFVPGLFWGWLFARRRSLVGVSVSHMMIGAFALFALDIASLFR